MSQELKKSGAWKTQVEMYKKQVAELHQHRDDEAKRADKMEFENKKLMEKLNALQREKDVCHMCCFIVCNSRCSLYLCCRSMHVTFSFTLLMNVCVT